MYIYASKCESPDTVGNNSVSICDFQTSYAYINNTACSESMVFWINTEHTYIGDLEVWIGYWDPSSSTHIEQKIWDHQGGSADNLQLSVHAEGAQNVHNWRLRVIDSGAGDVGAITEFDSLNQQLTQFMFQSVRFYSSTAGVHPCKSSPIPNPLIKTISTYL